MTPYMSEIASLDPSVHHDLPDSRYVTALWQRANHLMARDDASSTTTSAVSELTGRQRAAAEAHTLAGMAVHPALRNTKAPIKPHLDLVLNTHAADPTGRSRFKRTFLTPSVLEKRNKVRARIDSGGSDKGAAAALHDLSLIHI